MTTSPILKLDRPLVSLDLETTGTDVMFDRIVQIAIVTLRPDGVRMAWSALVNPERPIPKESTEVHGITDDAVANAPTFANIAVVIVERLADCDVTGYNVAGFDLPLLNREFERAGWQGNTPWRTARVIDAMSLYYDLNPRTLAAAYQEYTGDELDNAHDALADADGALTVLIGMAQAHDLPLDAPGLEKAALGDRVDLAGKFKQREDGRIVLAFGKHAGELAAANKDYCAWMLGKSFPDDTLNVARQIVRGDLS